MQSIQVERRGTGEDGREAPLRFEPPGPGTWVCDASHVDRPLTRQMWLVVQSLGEGFSAGFAECGAMVESFDYARVHGFVYQRANIVGAPKGGTGRPPPKWIFKLICALHPAIRRRTRRAAEYFEGRLWRAALEAHEREWAPRFRTRLAALEAVAPSDLDEPALAEHVAACRAAACDALRHHGRMSAILGGAVGDYLVHAREWTGAGKAALVGPLAGASAASRTVNEHLDALVAALREGGTAGERLDADEPAAAVLASLEDAGGAIGEAASRWLGHSRHRLLTSFELDGLTGAEVPELLLRALRRAAGAPATAFRVGDGALRDRVPEAKRAAFDDLLADARAAYSFRDYMVDAHDAYAGGLLRRSLLELGRRLETRGALRRADHALDLDVEEIEGMLAGGTSPPAEEVASRVRHRTTLTIHDAPDILGPPPSAPPPAEWLPPAAARMQRAGLAHVEAMFEDGAGRDSHGVLRGLGVSPGRTVGRARLVLTHEHFGRIREGDVLVARITAPSYNVLLPLLGAVVTDRGGVLSHPAIVSREYGIPGVVGTREATRVIEDGATVEVDGDAGTVRVLA